MSSFRKKSFSDVMESAKTGNLKRTLGAFDLFLMGIGAIVGVGIFVIAGITAAEMSGPAITVSYIIAGVSCIFVAFCYTEVASMIPTSGNVYAYAYVSMGELMAWIVGWMTMLYLGISATTVASGWSGYVVSVLANNGVFLPEQLTRIPSEGGIINLPAVIITLLVTMMLIKGTKESAKLNSILVFVKMAALALFLVLALPHFDINNWFDHSIDYDTTKLASSPFMPFGIEGVMAGAALVFFGYNGFDVLASATEEAKNPERDIKIGILSAIFACIIIYTIASGTLVGVAKYNELNLASPLAYVLSKVGSNVGSSIVASGAIAGMSTVILMQMYSLSRLLFVMGRDGLLTKSFTKVHNKFHTPHVATVMAGIVIALIAGFCPLKVMGSLASLGALFTYSMVAVIMIVLRIYQPNLNRPFKCPTPYLIATVAVALCGYLMSTLLVKVGIYFIGWLVCGVLVYYFYAQKRSNLALNNVS